jgi:hypothetical protein
VVRYGIQLNKLHSLLIDFDFLQLKIICFSFSGKQIDINCLQHFVLNNKYLVFDELLFIVLHRVAEPEPPGVTSFWWSRSHQSRTQPFHPEPEPHKNDAALVSHCLSFLRMQ